MGDTIVTTQSVGSGISFAFASGIQGYIDIDVSLVSPSSVSIVFGINLITHGFVRKYPMTLSSGDTIYLTSATTSSPDFNSKILIVICFVFS